MQYFDIFSCYKPKKELYDKSVCIYKRNFLHKVLIKFNVLQFYLIKKVVTYFSSIFMSAISIVFLVLQIKFS